MKIFESIRATEPDFFLHSGDHIYADNPILAEVKLDDGTTWRNLVTEGTSKVAETLAEFRDRFRYNRLDEPSAGSPPRSRSSPSGTTTRSSTTGTPARSSTTPATP